MYQDALLWHYIQTLIRDIFLHVRTSRPHSHTFPSPYSTVAFMSAKALGLTLLYNLASILYSFFRDYTCSLIISKFSLDFLTNMSKNMLIFSCIFTTSPFVSSWIFIGRNIRMTHRPSKCTFSSLFRGTYDSQSVLLSNLQCGWRGDS